MYKIIENTSTAAQNDHEFLMALIGENQCNNCNHAKICEDLKGSIAHYEKKAADLDILVSQAEGSDKIALEAYKNYYQLSAEVLNYMLKA
jgi:hypothetical protein